MADSRGFTHRWLVMILAMTMQALVIGFGIYCFTFFVVPWMDEFGVQRSALMIGVTGQAVMMAFLSPLCGILIDRYPHRWLVVCGTLGFCAALAIIGRASSAAVIALAVTFMYPLGLILAGTLMAQSLVARAFTTKQGMALGISALGSSIGGLVMPVVITALLDHFHWRTVFDLLAAAIILILVPLALIALKAQPKSQGAAAKAVGRPTAALLSDRSVLLLGVTFVVPTTLFMGLLQNLGPFAADLALTQQRAGFIIAVSSVLIAVAKIAVGMLADRVAHSTLYYGLVALAGAGMLLSAFAQSFLPLAVGVCLVGLASGGAYPLISTVGLIRFGADNFGRVMGVVMGMAGLSGLAPLVAGLARDLSGSYLAGFLLLSPLALLGAACFYLVDRRAGTALSSAAVVSGTREEAVEEVVDE